MNEGRDTGLGDGHLTEEAQERLTKSLTAKIMEGAPADCPLECPFTPDQLEFLGMVFRDLMVVIGQSSLVVVGYNPVSEAYFQWKNGQRLDK